MSKLEGPLLLTLEQLINFLSDIVLKELNKDCYIDKVIRLPEKFVKNLVDLNKKKAEFRFFNYIIKKYNDNQWEVNEVV